MRRSEILWEQDELSTQEEILKRDIESDKSDLENLKDKMVREEETLHEIRKHLKHVSTILKPKIYIIMGTKKYPYVRGKVWFNGKWKWFHVGTIDSCRGYSDSKIRAQVKQKFYQSINNL